ncbi:hypothetical protein [Nocardioides convexus]|uniref:hypothetical protein n=1 Tax=Nocardioides convexus TaxID=2712224 RepID=UPI002418656D|nr:hypothetical protein [Nocardioides convexus]
MSSRRGSWRSLGSTVEHVVGRPPRPLSLDGLVAEPASYGRRTGGRPGPARRGRSPAGPAGGGAARPARAGAGRRSRHLVGHASGQPLRAAGARGGPAGADLGEHAGGARRLPYPVVPDARGGGRRAGPPVGQPRRAWCTPWPSGWPPGTRHRIPTP